MFGRALPTRPLRRRLFHAGVGIALAATVGITGPGSSAQAADPPGEAECDPSGLSTARVGHGSDHGIDPNSVTPAEAAALQAQLDRQVDRLVSDGTLSAQGSRSGDKTIKVRTFVHIIKSSTGEGHVTREQLRRQMEVINRGYAGATSRYAASTPFRFHIVDVDVTRKDAWYNWTLNEDGTEPAAMQQAKRALHRGGYKALNIYIAGLGSGLLGYANYPGTSPLKLDGLVILNESMPGGDAAPYNRGDTATHEIGHWLGLFHTFENGCMPPGDYVKDTPYQDDGENIFYCGDWEGDGSTTVPDNTCPQPGKDPVHNFMSYGDDLCLDRFTPGQAKRQVQAWFAFRAGR
jgi:hypothetical protein